MGVASSALFDLEASDAVFREEGEERYRAYQREHLDDALEPGVAFPFIRRLLDLNDLSEEERLVEVVILSRNDPETGLRVMRSVQRHGLNITRAIFMQGQSPYRFMEPLRMSLFLSANEADVREAISLGFAAGRVVGPGIDDDGAHRLRLRWRPGHRLRRAGLSEGLPGGVSEERDRPCRRSPPRGSDGGFPRKDQQDPGD